MKPFDPECQRLATYFLNDWETRSKKISQADRISLASWIQTAIEDWMDNEDKIADEKSEAARERD